METLDTIQSSILPWVYLLAHVLGLIAVICWPKVRYKTLVVTYFAINVCVATYFRFFHILLHWKDGKFDHQIYDSFRMPNFAVNLADLLAAGLLVTFVILFRKTIQQAGASPIDGFSPQDSQWSLVDDPTVDPRLRGYGGWVSFFGALRLFLDPCYLAWTLFLGSQAVKRESTLQGLFALEMIGSLALIIFGIYVAIALRRIWPGAVRLTKIFLVVAMCWLIVDVVLCLSWEIPASDRTTVVRGLLMRVPAKMVGCIIWFWYFSVSKRVRTTYRS